MQPFRFLAAYTQPFMKTNYRFREGIFTMRKYLLALFIGLVITINLYGLIDNLFDYIIGSPINDTVETIFYME